nr:hypothetical protein Iba_chr14cCG2880 [Ipomoea batatas]
MLIERVLLCQGDRVEQPAGSTPVFLHLTPPMREQRVGFPGEKVDMGYRRRNAAVETLEFWHADTPSPFLGHDTFRPRQGGAAQGCASQEKFGKSWNRPWSPLRAICGRHLPRLYEIAPVVPSFIMHQSTSLLSRIIAWGRSVIYLQASNILAGQKNITPPHPSYKGMAEAPTG